MTLSLSGFAPGSTAMISFDLFILKSWDGSSPPGPDRIVVASKGNTLLDTTFANYPGQLQRYPGTFDSGELNEGRTGAAEANTLGYSFNFGDAVYAFALRGSTSPTARCRSASRG